ncbi:hypothetical protein [Streptomyces coerulescens]|uniref:Uncharacterized protein n=1 Tax=Streptomyces coerulescens TaxID=29304 RepID=A0ABW0CJ61_STRCD
MEVEQRAEHGVGGPSLAGVGRVRQGGVVPDRLLPVAALALHGQTGGGQTVEQGPIVLGGEPGDHVQGGPALGGVAQQVVHARRVGDAVGVR